MITVVKVMTRLVSIRKVNNMIAIMFNVENESRYSSARIIKMMKMVTKLGKSSKLNTRIRRNTRSNNII